jgi:hypothetical protein
LPEWSPTQSEYAIPTVSSLRNHCLKAEGLRIQFAIHRRFHMFIETLRREVVCLLAAYELWANQILRF